MCLGDVPDSSSFLIVNIFVRSAGRGINLVWLRQSIKMWQSALHYR
jgi:hypothetical protein